MNPTEIYEDGKRVMRQLLLHRYKTLIQKIEQTYALPEDKVRTLEDKILTIHWFDYVL
jgi:hypothetical protein